MVADARADVPPYRREFEFLFTNAKVYESSSRMAEWFAALLNRFGDSNDIQARENILTELKIKISSLGDNVTTEIARTLDLSRLFGQLTSNDK